MLKKKNVAFTLGYYINGPRGFKADWRDHLFVHEYGHIIQGNIYGPFYLSTIAIPSLMDSWLEKSRHSTRWYEAQASSIGGKYFNKKYGTGAKGYVPNSEFFFDINSFRNEGVESLYFNPRNGGKNDSSYTSHFRIHWSDVGYFLIGRIF